MFRLLGNLLDSNEREINRLNGIVEKINSLEKSVEKLKDAEFSKKTEEFKKRLEKGETLDDVLPEAFALVREASQRVLGMRHFDVQLIASIALHQGKIAEQKTGEGKTLSATPALYLNALTGKGVHLVTVNDYLVRRDAGWMAPLFHLLGLTTSAIIHDQSFIYDPEYIDESAQDFRLKNLKPVTRKEAYAADITYGINSEYGFDYLRDNMAQRIEEVVQRGFYFAVVDEVDSVLIDEARTPHIISAPDEEPTQRYYEYAEIVSQLNAKLDYEVDEKLRTAHLTEHGIGKIEKIFGLSNIYEQDFDSVHHLEAALKARTLFHKDKEYVVKDNQVIIVDEHTGRIMPGRRFSEGIHQALEAKEGVPIQRESKTLATVSLQNYFRMYEKLAGMTGTAVTEAEEFHKIYNLEVVAIPTYRPMVREDVNDMVYKTPRAKYAAVVREIEEAYKAGQPVLVGTTSIDKNSIISDFLKRYKIPHNVLNAKNHLQEAHIISQAGRRGAVTVATNMAGRGVDIILGGAKPEEYEFENKKDYEKAIEKWKKDNEEVKKLGGLYVIGTERHESRRIDNQLRGRAGRQGDPGKSRFFVSLEDDIMRLFGGDRISNLMTAFNLPEDQPLEHGMVNRAIEQAQSKVEGFHFDSRKHVVEYDDVKNKQREIIYKLRRRVLEGENLKEEILEKIQDEIDRIVEMHYEDATLHNPTEKIAADFATIVPVGESQQKDLATHLATYESAHGMKEYLKEIAIKNYTMREEAITEAANRELERIVYLQTIDRLWREHLDAIDDLELGVRLRAFGNKDPLVEFKNEAYLAFQNLMTAIDSELVYSIYKWNIVPQHVHTDAPMVENVPASEVSEDVLKKEEKKIEEFENKKKKIGRNDPCWCGSGKKYKKCHYPN